MTIPLTNWALTLGLSLSALPCQEPVDQRIPVLLISGANNHDWEWTSPEWKRALEATGRFKVDITYEPKTTLADAKRLRDYRAFVLDYNGPSWGEAANANFVAAVRAGTGVTVIHAANNPFPGWVEFETMVCYCWRKGTGHGRFHPFDVIVKDRNHPVTSDMPDMRAHPDELYHRLKHMHNARHRVLATALSAKETGGTGREEPMIIVRRHGEARIFHTPLGHVWRGVANSRKSILDPQLRQLVARGTEWAATGAVTLPPVAPNTLSPEEVEAGFELLFDGSTTKGLRGFRSETFPDKGWVVRDGAIEHVSKGGGGDIVTEGQYGDFELRFEWAVGAGANSGVMFRVSEKQSPSYRTGPEYQILDDAKHKQAADSLVSAGALYGLVAPEGKQLAPVGQFNTARIVVQGSDVEHWLNGTKICSYQLAGEDWERRLANSKFAKWEGFGTCPKGHIVFQDHGDQVRYRSIRIRH